VTVPLTLDADAYDFDFRGNTSCHNKMQSNHNNFET